METKLDLTQNALTVLERRYLKKDKNGKVIEKPEDMLRRVAKNIAQADSFYSPDENTYKTAEEFYHMMAELDFLPNSPTLMNAGREIQQLSACFVLPVEDSIESIFETIKNTAIIHQSGGGTGFSFSHIRPKNDIVMSTKGIASGPISFMSVFNTTTETIKQGGCVEENTLISTEKGLIPIKELGSVTAGNYETLNLEIFSDNGVKKTEQFYNNGIKPVKIIVTKDGYRFTGTLNHKIRIIDVEGNYVWKELKDIEKGDQVALQMGTFKGRSVKFSSFDKKFHANTKVCNLPEELDVSLSELIGYFTGDGAFHQNKIILGIPHDCMELRDYFIEYFEEKFNIRNFKEEKLKNKGINLIYPNKMLFEWFKHIGVDRKNSYYARIPDIIFKSNKECVLGFLRGLFEADSFVNEKGYSIILSSISQKLINQTQLLLLSLGIPSRIRVSTKKSNSYGNKDLYVLTINTPAGLEVYKKEIGFLSKKKKEKLDKIKKRKIASIDVLPNQGKPLREFCENLDPEISNGFYRKIHNYTDRVKDRANFTRQRAEILIKEYDFLKGSFLEKLLEKNQYYSPVIEILDSKASTLDLVVPEGHTYIANGFVSHNTRRGANMGILRIDHPEILEFIKCKSNEGDMNNFNISVAVTDKFMEALKNDEKYDLINPRSGEVTEKLRAKDVFNLITDLAWKNGEPGVIFIDRINKDNPTPLIGEIESTNPCVTGDTLISTEKGLMRMKDLVEKYPEGGIEIATDNRVPGKMEEFTENLLEKEGITFNKITKAFCTGKKETYKIETEAGYEMKCSSDHKILTHKGWIKVTELDKEKHKILIQSGEGKFNSEYKLPFEVQNEFTGKNGRKYTFNMPDRWSKELGQALGWLTGDGWLRDGDKNRRVGFTFSEADESVMDYLKPLINNWYGADIKEVKRKNGVYHLSYHSKYFVEYFKGLGIKNVKADNKAVPESIFTAPREAVIGFIQGLFSADGTVNFRKDNASYVRLTSKSQKLLKEVQIILLNLGIKSRIYNRSREAREKMFPYKNKKGDIKYYKTDGISYELEISRNSVLRFLEEIGFLCGLHREKTEKFSLKNYRSDKFQENIKDILKNGEEIVYDLTEPKMLNYITNGILSLDCGEQPLLPYESCNLGSVNLAQMVIDDKSGAPKIHYKKLRDVVHKAVHFLDNVIDMNRYPLKSIEKMTKDNRKIGLGVMGFSDMLIKLGIAYNSEKGVKTAENVMEFISIEAKCASQNFAKKRGAFPNIFGSIYDRPKAPKIRNATVTTVAPTGTISIIAGCSSGIEPLFAICYVRNILDNDKLVEVHPLFKEVAQKRGFYSPELMNMIAERGTIQDIPEIPEDVKNVFVTSHEITPEWHIKMQAAFQKHTDNAVSKTVNFPNSATKEDVKNSYLMAYKYGCKGLTIYRDGSRNIQVLSKKGAKKSEEIKEIKESMLAIKKEDKDIQNSKLQPRPRPTITKGATLKMPTGCGNLYVTINEDQNGLCEVFARMGKSGGCAASQAEVTGRLISLALRAGVDTKSIVKQLRGIRCPVPCWDRGSTTLSCSDAIGKAIEKYTESNGNSSNLSTKEITSLNLSGICPECPECGNLLEFSEGCVVCKACGYSQCG